MVRLLSLQFAALCIFICAPVFGDEGEVREALRIEIEQLRESGRLRIGGIDVASGNLLAEIYERRGFSPTWVGVDKLASLIDVIKATARDGLDPDDYHLAKIEAIHSQLEGGRRLAPNEQATLDIALTDSLIRLGYHRRFGKVNPYDLDPTWNFTRELAGRDPAKTIQEAIDAESLSDYLAGVFPRAELYLQLQSYLEEYRGIVASGGWPRVPEGFTLKPGTADERLPVLAHRLAISGDLSADVAAMSFSVYSDSLLAAVENFQARHGLDVDGVVGPATLRAMNVSAEDRVNQIRLNLERARWVLDDLEDDFIVVNIAAFRAYLYRDRKPVWSTRVVVGKTYHKTPVFRSLLKYIVFNPTWTVPYSIATKEMLPAIKRDPAYLSARNFDVKDRDGNIIDPASVDWSQVTTRNFRFTFVQRPGLSNALGEIKFIFPNRFSVYLHDTPSKSLFARAERTFSHGCIRVQRPFDFAEVLLQADGWTSEMIQAERATRKTRSVFLAEPLPVLLLYWTAAIGEDGQIQFFDDVYERDQKILTALDSPYRIDISEF